MPILVLKNYLLSICKIIILVSSNSVDFKQLKIRQPGQYQGQTWSLHFNIKTNKKCFKIVYYNATMYYIIMQVSYDSVDSKLLIPLPSGQHWGPKMSINFNIDVYRKKNLKKLFSRNTMLYWDYLQWNHPQIKAKLTFFHF